MTNETLNKAIQLRAFIGSLTLDQQCGQMLTETGLKYRANPVREDTWNKIRELIEHDLKEQREAAEKELAEL